MEREILDWRGTPITVGCSIVWAVSHSSSISVNEGIVLELLPHSTNYDEKNYCGRCANRSVGRDYGWSCRGVNLKVRPTRSADGWARDTKPVKLTALERVVVIVVSDTDSP